MPLLEVRGLEAGYRDLRVLQALDLCLDAGTATAVVGEPAAGKSTLLLCVAGALRPAAGRILLGGADVTGASVEDMQGRGCVLVPAGRRVFPTYPVEAGLRLTAGTLPPAANPGAAGVDERLARCYRAFPALLPQRARAAGCLAEAERQMLAVAHGLMAAPVLLLVDEPLAGLTREGASGVLAGLRRLAAEGTTLLLCTDRGPAPGTVDRVLALRRGRLRPDTPHAGLG